MRLRVGYEDNAKSASKAERDSVAAIADDMISVLLENASLQSRPYRRGRAFIESRSSLEIQCNPDEFYFHPALKRRILDAFGFV